MPPPHSQTKRTLRDLLNTPQFTLVRVLSIQTNVATLSGRKVSLYENNCVQAPTAKFLHLKMMSLRHDIVVPLHSVIGN